MHVVTQRSPTNSLKSCLGLDAFYAIPRQICIHKVYIITKYFVCYMYITCYISASYLYILSACVGEEEGGCFFVI